MPVPKRKTSRARRDKRSSCKGIKPKSITGCQTCQAPIAPHSACQECGYYKGVKILRTKAERAHERGKIMQQKQSQAQQASEAAAAPAE